MNNELFKLLTLFKYPSFFFFDISPIILPTLSIANKLSMCFRKSLKINEWISYQYLFGTSLSYTIEFRKIQEQYTETVDCIQYFVGYER